MQPIKPEVCVVVCILYLFNFMTIVDTPQIVEQKITYNGYVEVKIRGAQETLIKVSSRPAIIKEIGNIPLRTQINNSCGTTSLGMYMDYIGMPYKTQEYYDLCADRGEEELTYLEQLESCSSKLGIESSILIHKVDKLKTGDIVLYKAHKNDTGFHYSVVDSINEETIRLADPLRKYVEYNIEEFKEKYTNYALVLNS